MTVDDLDALARELRLTPRQRAFADALAADPERNQTRAAIAAGASSQPEIQGSRWARSGKVQRYLQALQGYAIEKARTKHSLASIEEVLDILTRQARSAPEDYTTEAGDIDIVKLRGLRGQVRGLRVEERRERGPTGEVSVVRVKDVRVESPQGAAEKLLRYHVGDYGAKPADQPTNRINVLAIINGLPVEQVRALREAFVAGAKGRE